MTRFDWLSLIPRRFKPAVAAGIVFLLIAFPNAAKSLFMEGVYEADAQTTSELHQILDPILARAKHRETLSQATRKRTTSRRLAVVPPQ